MKPCNNDLTACRGDMLKRFYLAKYHAADRKRAARLSAVKNRVDAEKYIAEIRRKLETSFGPIPPAVPFDAKVTGQFETEKLMIDKVLFQSRPGYVVSALFYRPKTRNGKFPGVLFLCGHSDAGKAAKVYQRVPQSLALCGFGVLAVDPYGQGERREFGGGAAAEHNRFGHRLGLVGEFFGAWRLHDALTALEYLKRRPEIDASRLGATGCSGGGTLTSYLNAFSRDLTMIAPVCSMTRLSSNLENELYTDCEQNPPRFRELGLDEGDLLIASVPRPVILGVQDNDFFDPRGTEQIYREVRRIYRLFGADDKMILSSGQGEHGYSEFHQREICRYFASLAESRPVGDDGDIQLFEESELHCTPNGNVWKLPGAKSTAQILNALVEKREPMSKDNLCDFWCECLGLEKLRIPAFTNGFQQYIAFAKLHASRFLLQSEPGIEITLKKISSVVENRLGCGEKAVVLIPHFDGIREMPSRASDANHGDFFILEPRGIGESLPCRPESDLIQIYGPLHASCALMLGESLLGGQVRDILSGLLLLKKHGLREVTLYAEGGMCIPASLAALLSPVSTEVKFRNAPESWGKYLSEPEWVLPHELPPFGILQHTDLPELYRAVGKGEYE